MVYSSKLKIHRNRELVNSIPKYQQHSRSPDSTRKSPESRGITVTNVILAAKGFGRSLEVAPGKGSKVLELLQAWKRRPEVFDGGKR